MCTSTQHILTSTLFIKRSTFFNRESVVVFLETVLFGFGPYTRLTFQSSSLTKKQEKPRTDLAPPLNRAVLQNGGKMRRGTQTALGNEAEDIDRIQAYYVI